MAIPDDWVEHCDDTSPNTMVFEYGQSHATIVYDIPFQYFYTNFGTFDNDATNLIGYILGYSEVDNSFNMPSPYQDYPTLSRVLPLAHPYLDGLWATKILNAVPMRHVSDGTSKTESGIASNANGTNFAVYDFVRTTIFYETLPYAVLSDAQIQEAPYNYMEMFRFCTWAFDGGIKTQAVGTPQQLLWSDYGVVGGVPGAPNTPCGTSFQPVIIQAVSDLVITWHRVPYKGIFKVQNGIPLGFPNISYVMGSCNLADWPFEGGFYGSEQSGVLLCGSPKFRPCTYPVSPKMLQLADVSLGDLPVLYDVEFHLQFYDPPLISNPEYPWAATIRGWNTSVVPGGGGNCYYTFGNRASGGLPLYTTLDFNYLFIMNNGLE